jgi:hypothetical protein
MKNNLYGPAMDVVNAVFVVIGVFKEALIKQL